MDEGLKAQLKAEAQRLKQLVIRADQLDDDTREVEHRTARCDPAGQPTHARVCLVSITHNGCEVMDPRSEWDSFRSRAVKARWLEAQARLKDIVLNSIRDELAGLAELITAEQATLARDYTGVAPPGAGERAPRGIRMKEGSRE